MKIKLLHFVLVVFSFIVFSCNSDDDPQPEDGDAVDTVFVDVVDTVFVDVVDTVYFNTDSLYTGWRSKTGMFKVRSGYVAFAIGDKGYVSTGISGNVQTDGEYLSDLWEYSPETDTWSQKANFPGAGRRTATAFVLNDEAYVGLGFQSSTGSSVRYNDFWKYNPVSNEWIEMANFDGGARNAVYSFVVGGKAFVGGGFSDTALDDLWEYDANNDNWIKRADLPGTPRQGAASFVLNDTAYVMAGGDCCGLSTNYFNDLWAYDHINNEWKQKASFPADGRSRPIAFTLKNNGYLGFGSTSSSVSYYKDLWTYDNQTNSWSEAPEFPGVGRTQLAVFTIDGVAYTGCGLEASDGVGLNDFYEFIPE